MPKRKPRAGIKQGASAWYDNHPVRVVKTYSNGTAEIVYVLCEPTKQVLIVPTWRIKL